MNNKKLVAKNLLQIFFMEHHLRLHTVSGCCTLCLFFDIPIIFDPLHIDDRYGMFLASLHCSHLICASVPYYADVS